MLDPHPSLPLGLAPTEPRPRRLRVLDERVRGTRFVERDVTTVLNSPSATGMGWWSLNPYIGCEFGCTYCYARFAHRYASERSAIVSPEPAWQAFEHRIFVKQADAVIAALDRDIPRVRAGVSPGERTIVIGTATDPYQPAERTYRVTRRVLERLTHERGLHIGIITKSALITRDIDLLSRLATQHEVSVNISVISADPRLVRAFEPKSPVPHARLRALHALSRAGIRAGVLIAPILPGVTDSRQHLTTLLQAARAAGAAFAHYAPFRLYPGLRGLFFPALGAVNPALPPRYRARYPDVGSAPPDYRAALSRRFHRIAGRLGFTRDHNGHAATSEPAARQLGFWSEGQPNG